MGRPRKQELIRYKVAYLASVGDVQVANGPSQAASRQRRSHAPDRGSIARRLGVSDRTVRDIFASLVREGELLPTYVVSREVRSSPQWREAEREFNPGRAGLIGRLQAMSRYARSFHCELIGVERGDLQTFSRVAGPVVADLLSNARRVGVGCGSILGSVFDNIPLARPRVRAPELIIPIIGEPNEREDEPNSLANSSSLVAESLRRVLTRRQDGTSPPPGAGSRAKPQQISLRGVVSYVARRQRCAPVWEFVRSNTSYQRIFGDGNPGGGMISTLDCIVTGAGSSFAEDGQRPHGRLLAELIEKERTSMDRVSPRDLSSLLLGDIAGVLVARDGLKAAQKARVASLAAGMIAPTPQHFRDVIANAQRTRSPGVVLVLYGDGKVELAAKIIREGLVSTLVTTDALAAQIAARA